jgi:hypothetical protein
MVICKLKQMDYFKKYFTLCVRQNGLIFKTFIVIIGWWILWGEDDEQFQNISKV